jgi:uncharacterized protein (DUF362 family)
MAHQDQSRRDFLVSGAAATAATLALPRQAFAGDPEAKEAAKPESKGDGNWAAKPPAGFVPFSRPGEVVKVKKTDSLMPNKRYPKPEDAKLMLTRLLTELTGAKDLVSAVSQFVHKDDIVCVKVNGIAKENMSTNKELVIPFIEAMIESGVKAEKITLLEQYGGFFSGTRLSQQNIPTGVKIAIHQNKDAVMPKRPIAGTYQTTQFVRALTEATAAINFALIKDHSICGYTGAMKNMTHGCSVNPHDFHAHHASPQIALLYAQDVIRSRVRLNIKDGYKVMAHGGPLWKAPDYVKIHEAVYASTDPVAIDTIGWEIVEAHRKEFNLKSLTDEGRPPAYLQTAAGLGLGIHERSKINFREVAV